MIHLSFIHDLFLLISVPLALQLVVQLLRFIGQCGWEESSDLHNYF